MTGVISDIKREEILSDLIEIPLRSDNCDEALERVTELCSKALKSQACTLVWVDLEQRLLTQVACAGFDEEFKLFMGQHKFKIGALHEGVSLDYNLAAKGHVIKTYNLPHDGGGVANPEVAKKYSLQSALCYPLKLDNRVVGFLNHFSAGNEVFTAEEENLLGLFSRQAETIIKHFNKELALEIKRTLVPGLLTLPPDVFLKQLLNKACEIIPNTVCLIWKLEPKQKKLQIVAASDDVDEAYRKIELNIVGVKTLLVGKQAKYLSDVTQSRKYRRSAEAQARGWVSLLSVPMWVDDELIGLLDVYTKFQHYFTEPERELFVDLAALAALSIQKSDLQEETNETSIRRRRLETINQVMTSMAEKRSVGEILRLLLTKSLDLVGIDWGWVRRLNPSTGELEVTAKVGTPDTPRPLKYGEGIAWKAIIEREPQLANNVHSDEWKKWYVQFSSRTQAELAIPLLIDNVVVREGVKTKLKSQPIGVLNLESPQTGAFSETDITYLLPLVRQAALLIDRLEAEQKLNGLREVEREIAGKRNWREVLQTVVQGIKDTLGFEFVNVSLVDSKKNFIKSEYVVGIDDDKVEQFKNMAVHSLDGDDIQADIVRSRKVEVPDQKDERFDPEIFKLFHHEDLIRVFIPMIAPSTGEVIGTVEAGYQRSSRDFIYERDIRFLQSFIAYAVVAIDPSRLALLQTISHEFRASIGGIRSNADYLLHMWRMLKQDRIENKLNDILTDGDILLLNVGELEYILGRTSQATRIEETLVIRDIVIKTANQLKPLVRERRFDTRKIEYPLRTDIGKVRVYVDRAKLNQVVYNLLLNSIKYAEDDPELFSIQIGLEERDDEFVLKFADWGMGVRKGFESKIFEHEFRAPEAKAKDISGSGLGLTIARARMREIGGDLILVNNRKPTEFHMLIPKKLMEAPE
ncbi:MAG TPA: GAF domain-containing protein [Pyrinomonadaceae bacterium]|jgi:GAF domain-containing protein/signal transduction histidine kinase